MRIPLPLKFKSKHIALFTGILFLAQQINGTTMLFSVLTTVYIVLFAIAFNLCGGLAYPSGAWVFFNGMLTAVVGLSYKNLLGESGQSNLQSPETTMGAYCVGMCGVMAAAYVCKRLRKKKAILGTMAGGSAMKLAAIGCLFLGLFLHFFAFLVPPAIYTALAQLNRFSDMALLLGVFYEVTSSNGARSTNWIVWIAAAEIFGFGIIGFSKEGIFTPAIAWLLPCVVLGYRFSRAQVIGFLLAMTFAFYYLVPFAQLGRGERSGSNSLSQNAEVAIKYLSDLPGTRKAYLEQVEVQRSNGGVHFYNQPQGLFDRLEMLDYDDALITATDNGQQLGITPTILSYLNVIPHVFHPGKPVLNLGNTYAREIGILPESDDVTGISFSPFGDAYHQLKWFGVSFIVFFVLIFLFLATDSMTGDVRLSPWGLLPIVVFAHIAPEELISGSVYMTIYLPLTLVAVAAITKYVMPLFSKLFLGGHSRAAAIRPLNLERFERGRPDWKHKSP